MNHLYNSHINRLKVHDVTFWFQASTLSVYHVAAIDVRVVPHRCTRNMSFLGLVTLWTLIHLSNPVSQTSKFSMSSSPEYLSGRGIQILFISDWFLRS